MKQVVGDAGRGDNCPDTARALHQGQQEQDVIALFHELIGLNVLKGIRFFATSQSDRYDSLFMLRYKGREQFAFQKPGCPLGVRHDWAADFDSEPRVLEYKYDFDSLMDDFAKEIKFEKQVSLVVCWRAGKRYKERYFLNSLLRGGEGTSRETYGATHQAFLDGSAGSLFEVVVLEDLMRYLIDPENEEARQKIEYH